MPDQIKDIIDNALDSQPILIFFSLIVGAFFGVMERVKIGTIKFLSPTFFYELLFNAFVGASSAGLSVWLFPEIPLAAIGSVSALASFYGRKTLDIILIKTGKIVDRRASK